MAAYDAAPIPGATYAAGTMSTADIYPTHSGIGGITTQDRALPAFADAQTDRAQAARVAGGSSPLMGTPAGYLALLIIGLLVGAWVIR